MRGYGVFDLRLLGRPVSVDVQSGGV